MKARKPIARQQSPPAINVLLVDHDPYVREGIRSCLTGHKEFRIVGQAATAADAVDTATQLAPHVIILSASLPGTDAFETTRSLRVACPAARVLILGDAGRPQDLVQEAVRAGAPGYLSRAASPNDLMAAIQRVHAGGTFFAPDVAQAFFNEFVQNGGKVKDIEPRLSERERQVLACVVDGLPNRQVAHKLNLSVRTVEKHRQRVMRKVGARRATELVKMAVTRGWVTMNPIP